MKNTDSKTTQDKDITSPLIYNQEEYHGYGVHGGTGDIYSSKRSGGWKRMSFSVSGQSPYPHGIIMSGPGVKKSIVQHIAVHETLNPELPVPPGMTSEEWRDMPPSAKRWFRHIWQVNHKDHDHLNHGPSNLEWTTQQENVNKYQRHRRETA